jgi:general secretion pathway protein G
MPSGETRGKDESRADDAPVRHFLQLSAFRLHPYRRSAFSLVEVMVVVVIIGLLAGVVTYAVTNHLDKAKIRRARADISNYSGAVDLYYADKGRFPDVRDGLKVLVPEYVKVLRSDPWGRPYVYARPGRGGPYDVVSLGGDGREGGAGTDADLTNWDPDTLAVGKSGGAGGTP